METSLLTTKLNIPPLRLPLVSRPRLIERLQATLNNSLILISAPAGFGKTTLLSEWARHSLPCNRTAWVSLDEGDNDPARFWDYFIAALRTVQPALGEAALLLLRSPQPLPIESVLTPLINDLNNIPEDYFLVLDDYHFIQSPPVHKGITFLLENLPPRLHLVIATRIDPPLPLAHLRGKGMMFEMRAHDLRFTLREAADLIAKLGALVLSSEDIEALNTKAEGWIVGLKMALLSMQGMKDIPAFISSFTGTQRYIMDYLLEEVLQRQPLEIREFLLKTSILERLSGSLCDAVTGGDNGKEILSRLEDDNLFIVLLDESRQWYRYEHLFAELLRHRLELEYGKETTEELQKTASRWYEGNGFVEDAINHALAAQDWEMAMRLISIPEVFLPRQATMTVLNWLQAIPSELIRADVSLSLKYAWALIFANRFDEAEIISNYLDRRTDYDDQLQGRIAALKASLARNRGDAVRTEEYAQKALSLLPANDITTRAAVCVILGGHYMSKNLFNEAEPLLKEAYENFRHAGAVVVAISPLTYLSMIAMLRGKLHQAERMLEQALGVAGEIPMAASAHMYLSTIHYIRNDQELAVLELERAIEIFRFLGMPVQDIPYLNMASALLARGDIEGAARALEEADRILNERESPPSDRARNAAYHIMFALEQEDPESTSMWLDRLSEYEESLPIDIPAVAVRLLFNCRGRAAASERWRKIYQWASRDGLQSIVVSVLLAQALDARSPDVALDYLAEALTKGKPAGFVRFFVNFGMPLAPLLRKAISRGIETEYARKLLTIIEAEEERRKLRKRESTLSPARAILSKRELEILRLLAEGLTNQQIADKLFISLFTVKAHVRHILDKLDAGGRSEAVSHARQLKLL